MFLVGLIAASRYKSWLQLIHILKGICITRNSPDLQNQYIYPYLQMLKLWNSSLVIEKKCLFIKPYDKGKGDKHQMWLNDRSTKLRNLFLSI